MRALNKDKNRIISLNNNNHTFQIEGRYSLAIVELRTLNQTGNFPIIKEQFERSESRPIRIMGM